MGPRHLLTCAVMALVFTPASVSGGERNNYYKYVDENGVIHITNVRNKTGAWKLYKSLPGSGSKAGPGGTSDSGHVIPQRSRVDVSSPRTRRYDSYIMGAARRYELPESLVRAVIHTESNYHASAVSRAGAMGLMQLMPATARYLGVQNAFDPRQNIYGGAKFLRILANHFNGDMVLVLAAYNAGAGSVKKYGGVPPYAETRAYVRGVLRRYHAYERQAQLGGNSMRPGPMRHLAP